MTAYSVDVDELRAVIAEMSSCERALVDLSGDVEAETLRLHALWTGHARDAHACSHGQWRDEFCDMSQHLDTLRGLADVASGNYTAAVEANAAMWEQFR